MSVGIAGCGWVTPLGTDLQEVWEQVRRGVRPTVTSLTNPESGRALPFIATPPEAVAHLSRNPRLRRSSTISMLAVAAGLSAIENAGITMTPEVAARTAVVFAISDGSVQYTRKFYDQIVKLGANAASPMLFPETVYNAPASHLAALLGIDGASYTLVGDGSVGLSALHFAGELLETSDVEQVVVVGAEEGDWILCEAYKQWRLARTPLAEGAAAIVLKREGRWSLRTHPGAPIFRRFNPGFDYCDARVALIAVLNHFAGAKVDHVISSANGTYIDRTEVAALSKHFANIPIVPVKKSFGESPGAGAIMQVVAAALSGVPSLVTVIGMNQQSNAALVSP